MNSASEIAAWCTFALIDEGIYKCQRCGATKTARHQPLKLPIYRLCDMPAGQYRGAGHAFECLARQAGFDRLNGCGCKMLSQKMDVNGPAWCRENCSWLTDKILANARKASIPISRAKISELLEVAIEMAESTIHPDSISQPPSLPLWFRIAAPPLKAFRRSIDVVRNHIWAARFAGLGLLWLSALWLLKSLP